MAQSDLSQVKALTFDVFGTVVDWRGSIIRDCTKFGAERGIDVDWGTFADTWRGAYRPSMDRVRRGELPWTNLDTLHRMVLDELLVKFGISGLSEGDIDHLNRVWHRLDPWRSLPIRPASGCPGGPADRAARAYRPAHVRHPRA